MEKEDVCPICENSLTDVYRNHFNMVGGAHSMYRSAECKRCDVKVFEDVSSGRWMTSRCSIEYLDREITLEKARSIFEIYELQNKNVAKVHELTEEEAVEYSESFWSDFVNSIKEKDKIYTWKEKESYALAIVRGKFIIYNHDFQKL